MNGTLFSNSRTSRNPMRPGFCTAPSLESHTLSPYDHTLWSEESVPHILSSTTVPSPLPPLRGDVEQVAHVELRCLHPAHRISRHRRDVSESRVDAALQAAVTVPPLMLVAVAIAAAIAVFLDSSRLFRWKEKGVVVNWPKAKLEIRFPNERQFMIALLRLQVILESLPFCRYEGRQQSRFKLPRCHYIAI